MTCFTDKEMESIKPVISMLAQKVESGYKPAITKNMLPASLLNNHEMRGLFIEAVSSFKEISMKILENRPEDLSSDEWDCLGLICMYFINDCKQKGGLASQFAGPVYYTFTHIFDKKKNEQQYTPQSSANTPRSEGCYIATAVYGDYSSPQVLILRAFRDSFLQKRSWGRSFIKYYYKYSPRLVAKLGNKPHVSIMAKKILDSFVKYLVKIAK